MIKKLAFGCLVTFVASAAAGQNLWQDEQYLHSYDAYFDCYEGVINSSVGVDPSDRAAIDRMFSGAFNRCADARAAGTAAAQARVAVLQPHYSAKQRSDVVSTFRRGLVVFRLRAFFRGKGLGAQFDDYFERTTEF